MEKSITLSPKGFTLIELMVTLALLSIVLAIGVPSFREIIERNQLTSRINAFTASLHLARSEAVKRNRQISVCKSADGSSCGGTGYEQGWIVYAENGGIGSRENSEELIGVNGALDKGLTLRGSAGMDTAITFSPNGQSSAAGVFALCKDDGGTNGNEKSREINILFTGRIKIEKQAANCNP